MRFTLSLNLENSAFDLDDSLGGRNGREVADILTNVVARLRNGNGELHHGEEDTLRDANGNRVGKWVATEFDDESTVVRYFDSIEDAYGACQTDSSIEDGDVLVIARNGVVGIAGTWPAAITLECQGLHSVAPGYDWQSIPGATENGLRTACAIAHANGWPIDATFEQFKPAGNIGQVRPFKGFDESAFDLRRHQECIDAACDAANVPTQHVTAVMVRPMPNGAGWQEVWTSNYTHPAEPSAGFKRVL